MKPLRESKVEQGTPEWLAERAGHATASCFEKIIAVGRDGGSLKARIDYAWQLVGERIYGMPKENIQSRATEWGHDAEPLARGEYMVQTGGVVIKAGFTWHRSLKWLGCSLDGKIGADGTYESKCPKDSAIHLQTWQNGMPVEHKPQVQGGLWITEREWCDFVSYDPRAPQDAMLYIQRVYRDDKYIQTELEPKVKTFLAEVSVMEREVRAKILERRAA